MAASLLPETASEEPVLCETCAESSREASHHCDDCLANFCDRCADAHRKLRLAAEGGGYHHRVEAGTCVYDPEIELCPLDGQKMAFFCRSCGVRVCAECELTGKRHVLHKVVSLIRHVGQEKEKLLDKLDDVTTKTESISHLPDDIKSMSTQIELKWLERKELIRQEFASLFETLTTQQQKLLADMDEEVKKSLERLHRLQQDHDSVLSNTCQLSDECISAVQNMPRDQFINSYPQFLESVKHLESKVERMESPRDHTPAFLQVPFSLHKEKVHLHNCLQLSVFNFQGIKAREHHRFIPYDRLKEELSLMALLETPTNNNLPPSSVLRYNVDVYCSSKQNKKPVWSSKKPLRMVDVVINGNHGHKLSPGNLYMVKIQPVLTCTTHVGEQSVEGRVISIVIVTDTVVGSAVITEPVMASGDSHAIADTCTLLGSAFENHGEDNLSCTNFAVFANTNNNSSSRVREQSRCKPTKSHGNGKPLFDPFVSPPVLCNGRKVPLGQGEYIPTRTCYKLPVPSAKADQASPVRTEEVGGALCMQKRYVSDCCFEEARLMEDTSLKVSRMVLFDG